MNNLCVKCNCELIKCMVSGGIKEFMITKLPEKIFKAKESSKISTFVCPNCGYIEWYAEKPENFK